MKLTLLLFLLLFVPIKIFAQDPNCEYIITLKGIKEHKYSYKLIVEYEYEKMPIDSIKTSLQRIWDGWQGIQSSILKTNSNKKIMIGYLSDHCYPRQENTDQLRIIIARKRKRDNKVELMYSLSNLIPETQTEIIIEKFKAGRRKSEVFVYEKDYVENEYRVSVYDRGINANNRKIIYLK